MSFYNYPSYSYYGTNNYDNNYHCHSLDPALRVLNVGTQRPPNGFSLANIPVIGPIAQPIVDQFGRLVSGVGDVVGSWGQSLDKLLGGAGEAISSAPTLDELQAALSAQQAQFQDLVSSCTSQINTLQQGIRQLQDALALEQSKSAQLEQQQQPLQQQLQQLLQQNSVLQAALAKRKRKSRK